MSEEAVALLAIPRARLPAIVAGTASFVFAVYVVWLMLGSSGYVAARDLWLYGFVLILAALAVLARAWIDRAERVPWALLAAGMVLWACDDIVYTAIVGGGDPDVYPVAVDWGYLVFYPFALMAVVLLIRVRRPGALLAMGIDAVIVALVVGAMLWLLLPEAWVPQGANPVALAVAHASYLADLALVCLLLGVISTLGREAGGTWWMLLVGAIALWAGDSVWLLELESASYTVGTAVDAGWPLAFLGFAWGSCIVQAASLPHHDRADLSRSAMTGLPVIMTTVAFGLVLVATQWPLPRVTVWAAAGAVVLGLLRTVHTLRAVSVQAEIRRQAYVDDLTGLANRRCLQRDLDLGTDPEWALFLLDIDGFKEINDSLGHAAGDEVLITVAARLATEVRTGDTVARLGGDEFVVLLPGSHAVSSAPVVAERLRAAIAEPMVLSGVTLRVDASVGVALCPLHGETLEELLRAADSAMYQAKHSRQGHMVYNAADGGPDRGQLLFQQRLRNAVYSDELMCLYQPQIRISTGDVIGFEALVRWRHPEKGELGPAAFLQFAERTSLIRPLTQKVLDLAVAQAASWRAAGHNVRVSVNLSVANLMDAELPGSIADLLRRHGLPAGGLMLEVTESVFLAEASRARQVILGLRELGLRLSIDDYGTGYSSLAQIRTLAADELKLDTSFVTGVADRSELQSVVASTVLLAHGLGLQLVVEGVESQRDLRTVRTLGCDIAQGYYIGAPMSGDAATGWMQARAELPAQRRAAPATPLRHH